MLEVNNIRNPLWLNQCALKELIIQIYKKNKSRNFLSKLNIIVLKNLKSLQFLIRNRFFSQSLFYYCCPVSGSIYYKIVDNINFNNII